MKYAVYVLRSNFEPIALCLAEEKATFSETRHIFVPMKNQYVAMFNVQLYSTGCTLLNSIDLLEVSQLT